MATKNQQPKAESEVTNHGDVTEPKVLAQLSAVPDLQPLSDLPAGYEVLAERSPTAIGFSEVGGMVVLHF